MAGQRIGYIRVSTLDQQTERQLDGIALDQTVNVVHNLTGLGIGLKVLAGEGAAIDTTTSTGRLMFGFFAALTEFERELVVERTSAGLAAARAEGRIGGRRKKLDATKRREIAESVASGRKSGAEMARLYSVSQPTVSRIVAAHLANRA